MMPGYTGYIPQQRQITGARYGLGARMAVADWIGSGRRYAGSRMGISTTPQENKNLLPPPPQQSIKMRMPTPHLSISNYNDSVLGSRYGNIQNIWALTSPADCAYPTWIAA